MKHRVDWIDRHRWPRVEPNPLYPDGIDLDVTNGSPTFCKVELPYPARRCGYYLVCCELCKENAIVTTAGRRDDPRSIKLPCKLDKGAKQ